MKRIIAIIIISCFMFACGNTNETTESASNQSDSVTGQAVPSDPASDAPMTTPDSGSIASPAPVNASSAPTTATATGLNPAHGEPGHRCDIAVGAPLNSAPAATPAGGDAVTASPAPAVAPAPVTAPAPVVAPVTAPATGAPATTTAPGMNPPHGQPGHDCSIAVGAPLKK